MKMRLLTLLCLLLPCCKIAAMADSVQYQHYTINNGLPSNNVYCCLEDRLGYMWMATDGGIVRYNGVSFKIFNTYTGLPTNDYYGLQEDEAGRMWIFGLTTHFGYIQNDRYHEVMPGNWKSSRIGNHESFSLNGKRIAITHDIPPRLVLFDTAAIIKYRLSAGCQYYLGNTGLLYTYDFGRRVFEVRDLSNPFITHRIKDSAYKVFRKIFPVSQVDFCFRNAIYAINSQQIGCINLSTGRIIVKNVTEYGAAPNDNIYTYHINDYFYAYNLPGEKLVHVIAGNTVYTLDEQLQLKQKRSLPAAAGSSAQLAFWKKDRLGNEWYTTNVAGIVCRLAARNYIEPVPCKDSLQNSRFSGSYKGYSWWWDVAARKLYMADTAAHTREWKIEGEGRLESVTHLSDSILLLSFNHSARLMNRYTGQFIPAGAFHFFNKTSAIVDGTRVDSLTLVSVWNNQKAMSFYRNRKLLLLGGDSWLNIFYNKQDGLHLKRLVKNYCSQMTYDAYSNKYILYGIDEIFTYDPETDWLNNLSIIHNVLPEAGLITAIRTDRFANIYMLCAHDLFIFNRNSSRLQRINTGFNLTNARLEINGDNLVLLGSFGVAAAKVSAAGIAGAFHVSCNVRNHYYKRINNVWITGADRITAQTDRGWIRIDLAALLQDSSLVHRPESGNFSLVMTEPEMKKLNDLDTLRIAPAGNKLMLDAINFNGDGVLHYTYRTGNGEWQQSASGEILVDDLVPEANTILQVQVSDDAWQSGVINIVLYKMPYWWQTDKAKLLIWILAGIILVLLVLLTVYITSLVVRRSNEKRRMLTDLELRAIHAQINPHFIFNTLSTALYFISRKEYENAYGHVNKFSHLLRSYLKSSHDRYVLLSEEIDMLKRYVDLQQTRFEEKFDFELLVDNKVPVNNIQIPSLLLQPLVENAINHGLFHRKEKGLLKIGFEQGANSDQLIVTIEDNGIGRAAAIRMKQESMADKESYGSQLTQKLMDIFRRYEAMDIEIQYIDKELPETGTIVKLIIANMRYIV